MTSDGPCDTPYKCSHLLPDTVVITTWQLVNPAGTAATARSSFFMTARTPFARREPFEVSRPGPNGTLRSRGWSPSATLPASNIGLGLQPWVVFPPEARSELRREAPARAEEWKP